MVFPPGGPGGGSIPPTGFGLPLTSYPSVETPMGRFGVGGVNKFGYNYYQIGPLTASFTNKVIPIRGNSLAVFSDGGYEDCYVRFNDTEAYAVPLDLVRIFKGVKFERLYFSFSATRHYGASFGFLVGENGLFDCLPLEAEMRPGTHSAPPVNHRAAILVADAADPTLITEGFSTMGYQQCRFDINLNSGTPTYPIGLQVLFWNSLKAKYFRGDAITLSELPAAVVVDSRGGVVYCKVTSLAGTNPSLDIDAVLS